MIQDQSIRVRPLQILTFFARIIVGGVLIYAGATKALGPTAEFAAAIAAYQLVPAGWVAIIAMIWPWFELLVGTYLFFGFFTRVSFGAAAGLFLIFLIVVISAMLRHIDPGACGCFGMGFSFSIRQTAAMDAVLLTLCLVGFSRSKTTSPYSADSWIKK